MPRSDKELRRYSCLFVNTIKRSVSMLMSWKLCFETDPWTTDPRAKSVNFKSHLWALSKLRPNWKRGQTVNDGRWLLIVDGAKPSHGVYPPALEPVQCQHALIYLTLKPQWFSFWSYAYKLINFWRKKKGSIFCSLLKQKIQVLVFIHQHRTQSNVITPSYIRLWNLTGSVPFWSFITLGS